MWRGVVRAGLVALLLGSVLAPSIAAAQGGAGDRGLGTRFGGEPRTMEHGRLGGFGIRLHSPTGQDVPYSFDIRTLSGSAWLYARGLASQGDLVRALEGPASSPRLSGPAAPRLQGGAGSLVPYRDPSAKFSRNILIPRDFSSAPLQTEPVVAVNPKDPNHVIAGMIDYNFPGVTVYVSIDGGVKWDGPFQMKYPREELAAAGDPIMAFDQNGTVYIGMITLDAEEFRIGNVVGDATVSSISVAVSTDGGYTWSSTVPTSRSSVETSFSGEQDGRIRGEIAFEFLDKPWLAVGRSPEDASKNILYVSYTKFVSRYSLFYTDELPFLGAPVLETVIEAVRSEDGGITWSKPIEVSPRVRQTFEQGRQHELADQSPDVASDDPAQREEVLREVRLSKGGPIGDLQLSPEAQAGHGGGSKRVVQGSQPAVAPDGTVYVAWLDSTDDGPFEGVGEIHVARSDDGGKTFSKGRRASTFLEPGFSPRTTFFRYWGSAFAQLAVGPQGEVYVGYVALPSGDPKDDGNVFVVRSTDKGQRWDRATRVNDDETSRLQFFPSITVDPNGKVHAMWGDMRDDLQEIRYHIYYAVSEDQGQTFGLNSRVTDAYSNPNFGFPGGEFIGDYFSIKATEDEVYMVWADTRLGEFQGTNQKIGFARRRQMPNPSIFLSPGQGPAGRDVTVQGFNYQPNQELFITVGGTIVASERAGPEGTFTARLFVPISGEGAHSVAVLDASGNAATTSFFTNFGFDNLQRTAVQIQGLEQKVANGDASAQITDLKSSMQALLAAQTQTADDARSRDRMVLTVAAFAAIAAALALIGAGVAAIRVGRGKPAL